MQLMNAVCTIKSDLSNPKDTTVSSHGMKAVDSKQFMLSL